MITFVIVLICVLKSVRYNLLLSLLLILTERLDHIGKPSLS